MKRFLDKSCLHLSSEFWESFKCTKLICIKNVAIHDGVFSAHEDFIECESLNKFQLISKKTCSMMKIVQHL